MIGTKFYHGSIRKYVSLFGTLFNDIQIDRVDNNDVVQKSIDIPISYSEKMRYLSRINSNPDLKNQTSVILPRMAFEMIQMTPDATRGLVRTKRMVFDDTPDSKGYQYSPVPWNFEFELYIFVKNNEDGLRIIEQILPFFNPDFVVTADMVPQLNCPQDIPVRFTGITKENNFEGDLESRQTIIWTLTFTLNGWLYQPSKTGQVIKTIDANLFDGFPEEGATDQLEIVQTVPYLPNTAIEDIQSDDPWEANTSILTPDP